MITTAAIRGVFWWLQNKLWATHRLQVKMSGKVVFARQTSGLRSIAKEIFVNVEIIFDDETSIPMSSCLMQTSMETDTSV